MSEDHIEEDIDGTHGDILPYQEVVLLEPIECPEWIFPAVCILAGSHGLCMDQLRNGYVFVEFWDELAGEEYDIDGDTWRDCQIALVEVHVSKLRLAKNESP